MAIRMSYTILAASGQDPVRMLLQIYRSFYLLCFKLEMDNSFMQTPVHTSFVWVKPLWMGGNIDGWVKK